MKHSLHFVALLALCVAACDAPSAPDVPARTAIPADAQVTEYVLSYQAALAKIGPAQATVDFTVPADLDAAYDVRVYFEEVGTWVHLPYTLAGDYCGDFIDLDFLFFGNTVRLRVIPQTLRPSTRILPPDTRLKVVVAAP